MTNIVTKDLYKLDITSQYIYDVISNLSDYSKIKIEVIYNNTSYTDEIVIGNQWKNTIPIVNPLEIEAVGIINLNTNQSFEWLGAYQDVLTANDFTTKFQVDLQSFFTAYLPTVANLAISATISNNNYEIISTGNGATFPLVYILHNDIKYPFYIGKGTKENYIRGNSLEINLNSLLGSYSDGIYKIIITLYDDEENKLKSYQYCYFLNNDKKCLVIDSAKQQDNPLNYLMDYYRLQLMSGTICNCENLETLFNSLFPNVTYCR